MPLAFASLSLQARPPPPLRTFALSGASLTTQVSQAGSQPPLSLRLRQPFGLPGPRKIAVSFNRRFSVARLLRNKKRTLRFHGLYSLAGRAPAQ